MWNYKQTFACLFFKKHYFKLILAIKTISIDISSVIEQIHKKYFNRTVVSILKIPKNEKYH